MSVNIEETLKPYLASDGKSINIGSAVGSAFGSAVGTVISEIFSGSVGIDGANFSFSGNENQVTISGQGNAAPLVSEIDVTLIFATQNTGASMSLSGSIQSDIPISQAWPSHLNSAPFNVLDLSSGKLTLDVDFGASTFDLDISATASYEKQTLGTGLIKVQYQESLGFLAGFIVTGTWNPVAHWSPLSNLTFTEGGVFLSTVEVTDLSAFTGFPYLPDKIEPGLTFIAELATTGAIKDLASFFPSGTKLDLLANVPINNPSATTLQAALHAPATNSAFQFTEFSLEWQLNSKIQLTIIATFRPDKNDVLTLEGDGTLVYSPEPSLDADITLTGSGAWTHPFGIQNVTIDAFSFGFSLSEEGLNVAAEGTITVGTGSGAVILSLALGIEDFEAPSFFLAQLQSADKGKLVTIPELVQDFIPELNLNNFPLLNQISIGDLELLVVAAPIELEGKSYLPGVGITGDIAFFGYDLDFAFSLTSSPFAIQAKGMLSDNGGPIVIKAAGITIVTISDASGKTGPSACIDTTGGGYCGQSNYFTATAGLALLGLVKGSLLIQASGDGFTFDAALGVSTIFKDELLCEFYPKSNDIAASLDTSFHPGQDLNIPAWGPFPSFTIPLPNFDLVLAFGTVLPSQPIGPAKYMPTAPPYFYFYFDFTWGIVDFSVSFAIDWNSISGIFTDFGSWLVKWVENNALQLLGDIAKSAEEVAKLLVQIGWIFFEILEKLIETFINMAAEALFDILKAIIDPSGICGVATGDAALNPGAPGLMYSAPSVLADLTETDRGQSLLYHYYLNKPELDEMLRPGNPISGRAQEVLASHATQSNLEQGRILPAAIALINTVREHGSAEFKASADEVLPLLQQYQDKTYAEFLGALAA
jgi:hypothetical protein